ncbi:hypothetical protein J1605_016052 [Eschrichtius robustus]|uniref:Uncharacterized protein n=1 Tax=Eschrichtius robustus TaxID=9764 RepID=A0AB34GAH1_ESCRO|nr:hypothetical protein J1605_016052 [Eschrichtius robustus]
MCKTEHGTEDRIQIDTKTEADLQKGKLVSPSSLPCKNKTKKRASLVAQWLRTRLPMQGTRVRSLVREDPICRGAAKPVCHNYRAHVPQLLKPAHLEPVLRNKRSRRNEKLAHHYEEQPLLAATRESPREFKTCDARASLVAQWIRICLPMQGTRVRALVLEDPTCRRATKPMHHNY